VVALEQDDGLVFDGEIASEPIVVDGRYPGVRLAVKGSLAGARFKLQVDVGVGAEVVPEPAWVDYPVLLDMDQPRILAYAPETAIAEKFEAMVSLGEASTLSGRRVGRGQSPVDQRLHNSLVRRLPLLHEHSLFVSHT
jgi:hypothetical protein